MWQWKVCLALALGSSACAEDAGDKPGDDPPCVDEADCPPERTCGDGIIDTGETCDGANVPECPAGMVGQVTCSTECQADTSACVPPGGEVIVHVVEGTIDHPGVYVVAHKSDGTLLTECATNAAGLCVFTGVPADVMITVAYGRPMGQLETKYVTTFTHINAPQRIEFVIPAPLASGTVINVDAAVPGPYTGATKAWSANGCREVETDDFTTVHPHYFVPDCLAANQDGAVYGEARDDAGAPRAWSYLRKPVTGPTTFTLPAWSTSFATLTTELTNVPTPNNSVTLECTATLDGLVPVKRSRVAAPAAGTETFAAAVPSPLATVARCSVSASLIQQQSSSFCAERQTPPFTKFAFDGSELLPQLTATFATQLPVPIERWTCTLASQPTTGADYTQCFKGFASGGSPTTHVGWWMIAPGDFVGTLTAPKLGPMSPLPSFYFMAIPGHNQARRWGFSDVASYSDYLDGRVEPVTGRECAVFHSPPN